MTEDRMPRDRMPKVAAAAMLAGALLAALLIRVLVFPPAAELDGRAAAIIWHEDGDVLVGRLSDNGIMGTSTALTAMGSADQKETLTQALLAGEDALRQVEAMMSSYKPDSELSVFNSAPAGQFVEMSPEFMAVMRTAKQLADDSDGTFDVTVRPLIKLWKLAGDTKQLPTQEAIDLARSQIGWRHIELRAGGAVRLTDEVSVDLGGIAKGYGIDRAVAAMQQARCATGVVDAGGDVRFFGEKANGKRWIFRVDNPFGSGHLETFFEMSAGSVCTSGNYRRFAKIDGKRYSHIIDPRTGWPADAAPSMTVIAPTAILADGWATALSVLGPDGLELLPSGVEAMLIVGSSADDWRAITTPGFLARHTNMDDTD